VEGTRVFIIGGGRVGLHVAELLLADDYKVKVMEADEAQCHYLAPLLPGALVLHGDGTDVRALLSEGIDEADVVITVSDHEETNLLSAIMSKHEGAKRAIVLIKRADYVPLVFSLGIDAAISPRLVTAAVILRYLRGGNMLAQFTTAFREAEVVELEVGEKARAAGRSLSELGLLDRAIIGGVCRKGEILIPRGETVLKGGDRVILFALADALEDASRLFR
jgi:trk system potassium uptake protein TrkA